MWCFSICSMRIFSIVIWCSSSINTQTAVIASTFTISNGLPLLILSCVFSLLSPNRRHHLRTCCTVKARSHLYANANKARGTEANANECQKVACLAFATQANKQVFRWLFVGCPNGFSYPSHPRCSTWKWCRSWKWWSVHPHQYDCERIFLSSTDSKWIAFACSSNIRRTYAV